ncbi:hypothetical protein IB256_27455 [Pseudomonas sp. PDM17]|uniref:hypothetical protein n=1 Tax=Pseudomonas sp. PDM17 TaxID=2769285 RepID=UPI0017818B5F|nr:hypothetical protein [Pseudomonas sp. PDM17]MBD9504546.1 hypothetical protein [Pseudomonas sp. PDM17]
MNTRYPIYSIKFYAMVPNQRDHASSPKPAFFGVGHADNCRPVDKLWISFDTHFFRVHQLTSDGEAKSYLYKLNDIVGRLEIVEESAP